MGERLKVRTSGNAKATERIGYLDEIKGISILLVVFCHFVLLSSRTIIGNALMCLAWGAVPCFFMVTGGLMHRPGRFSWKKYFARLARVYCVLVVWKIIYLAVNMSFSEVTFSKTKLFIYLFLFGSIDGVRTTVMWFMYAYLMVLLFYPISQFLFRASKEGKMVLLFLVCVLFVTGPLMNAANQLLSLWSEATGRSLLSLASLGTILPFKNYNNSLFYFLLGAFFLNGEHEMPEMLNGRKMKILIPTVLVAVGLYGLMLVKFWQTGSYRWENAYLDSGYLKLATVVLSVGLYFLVKNCFEKRTIKWLAFVGKNTMGIYYAHYVLLEYLSSTVFWGRLYHSLMANIIKTAVMAGVCLAITVVMRKIPIAKMLVE